tara:strand:+ start:187 stop:1332 length:1146 start_codon:yes stop_codon:yes gene_type:complete
MSSSSNFSFEDQTVGMDGINPIVGLEISDEKKSIQIANAHIDLIEKIGEGGMGEVWHGRLKTGVVKNVAVKFSGSRLDSREGLRREANLAAKLDHHAITQISMYGAGKEEDAIVMDYVNGADSGKLMERFAKCNLHTDGILIPERFVAFIGWVCCEGLDYAHTKDLEDHEGDIVHGIIHRDISPSNILIDNHGSTKISDFGIGILSSESAREMGKMTGKLPYFAPEMIDSSVEIDEKADIYSLGASMYTLATSRNPISESTDSGNLGLMAGNAAMIHRTGFPPLEEIIDVEPEFARIVSKAMSLDPGERYSADEMQDALSAYMYSSGFGPTRKALGLYFQILNGMIGDQPIGHLMERAKKKMPYFIENRKIRLKKKKYRDL